jgi:hypothetical protein
MGLKAVLLILLLILFQSTIEIEFPKDSGFTWITKEGIGYSAKNVWVDDKGLHLLSSKEGNAGIYSKDLLNLGKYIFYFQLNFNNLLNLSIGKSIVEIISKNFTKIRHYIKDTRCFKEFDFEFIKNLTLFITLDINSVILKIYQGTKDPFSISSDFYHECFFKFEEKFRIEIDLIYSDSNSEVILTDFKFIPLVTTQTIFINQTLTTTNYETVTATKFLTITKTEYLEKNITVTKNVTLSPTISPSAPLDPVITIAILFTVFLAVLSYLLIKYRKK